MEVLDTNVIIRFLVGDNPTQQSQASTWFKEAESGKRQIVVQPLVVAEACFVLESFYKKKRLEIANAFTVFLAQKWLHVENRETLIALWPYYTKNLHFVDSFLLSWAESNTATVLSFDKKLLKLT